MLRPLEDQRFANAGLLREGRPLTEGCPHHPGIEFPAWLCCPRCREESEDKLRAAFFIAERKSGHTLVDTILDEGDDDPDQFEREMFCPPDIRRLAVWIGLAAIALILGAWIWAILLRGGL